MEYDGILKWGETETGWNDCNVCYFNPDCKGTLCSRTRKTFRDETGIHFAHADQLKGLIEEAEAGAQKWVRENTLFVCSRPNSCSINDGIHCSSHLCATACTDPCLLNGCAEAVCKPYRGKKGEPQKFSGIDKRVIESLIEECDAEAGPTAEDCSEVVPSGNGVTDDTEAIRSIQESKYNKDREFLRGEAGEVINSGGIKIIINDDLTPLSDIKVKAEVQEDDVEYVVAQDFELDDLVNREEIHDSTFRIMFTKWTKNFRKDDVFNKNEHLWFYRVLLLKCGFIERKVDDPVVNPGDTFVDESGGYYRLMVTSGNMQTLCNMDGTSHFGPSCEIRHRQGVKLSLFVGRKHLPEFKKVNVEIREVD